MENIRKSEEFADIGDDARRQFVDDLLTKYSKGLVDRQTVQEETGLSFGEILLRMGVAGLSLPVVRTYDRLTDRQKALYDEIFAATPPGDETRKAGMSTREAEENMLARCASVAREQSSTAKDDQEANVFRVAAMVIQSDFPDEAARLMQASGDYFSRYPDKRLPAVEVVRKEWVSGLPRLRDMLSFKLRRNR